MNQQENIKSVVQFYYLCNKLKTLIRSGWKKWNVKKERLESVAEHIYGTQMLAIAMHSQFNYEDIDLYKVIMMISIHELGEVIIGDLTSWDISKEEKRKIEFKAVSSILDNLILKKDLISLYKEHEEKTSKEAIFVSQCDKLECDLQSKLYDDCVDLNDQENNEILKDEYVNNLLVEEKIFSNMWLEYGLNKNNYDDNFKNVSKYVKQMKINNYK